MVNPTAVRARLPDPPDTPPMQRCPIAPRPWSGARAALAAWLHGGLLQVLGRPRAQTLRARSLPTGTDLDCSARPSWEAAARQRRTHMVLAVLFCTTLATLRFVARQSGEGLPALHAIQACVFALLFAWVSAGFFTAVMGFLAVWCGDPHALSLDGAPPVPGDRSIRTAIVMPICNEHVDTVFAGLRATCESLIFSGNAHHFDLFVLSDTSDPAAIAAEQTAWRRLRDLTGGDLRIYYRHRTRRTRRKAGNIADFCRRWGRAYRYMVILDADSIMTGQCLSSLVRLMEHTPRAGIIQTAPQACGLDTLHARGQQFAARLSGRLFTAGMQYWQLGESHYWGHNAIVRMRPFMQHCALARLPGSGGLSGDILSHDFVEAALMRRAGYEVWLAPDLPGSYEQSPPNLLEELGRDRRWCQGNLMNLRLIAEPGLRAVHRAMLATGALSYLSAPLWGAFVMMGLACMLDRRESGHALLPMILPHTAVLWEVTAVMLLSPRLLALLLIHLRAEQASYGGSLRVLAGAALESLLSVLVAPVRMAAHTLFVLAALTGVGLTWTSPARESKALHWADTRRRLGPLAVGAAALTVLVASLNVSAALWFLPVSLPLMLAPGLSILASRHVIGAALRDHGVLCTPEEVATPHVLQQAWSYTRQAVADRRWPRDRTLTVEQLHWLG